MTAPPGPENRRNDRAMTADLEALRHLLKGGALLHAVETAIGPLA